MNFVLSFKHWQVFLVLLVITTLSSFTIEGNRTLTSILNLAGAILYLLYPIVLGHALFQLLPEKIDLNYNLFLFNSFIVLSVYSGMAIVFNGESTHFTGLAALPVFYFMYAIVHIYLFPARVLKSIERDSRVGAGECFGAFLLVVFAPIGIWFLQPRLNKILENSKIESAAEANA
ncbi:MAG TPA: hypothetical protein VG737_18805 [Cyclobacteriaceae bacterium]|nr:hypothetical protein [Cyclobacteriaceae bacterium]